MLLPYTQTCDIQYYEVLDIPLPDLEQLKTLKVSFHTNKAEEVSVQNIRLPKDSVVQDVLNELKTLVTLDADNGSGDLRMMEVFYHKIYKEFPLQEKIENINDQYWTVRAEEIPKEEALVKEGTSRIIHVYHFTKEHAHNLVCCLVAETIGCSYGA